MGCIPMKIFKTYNERGGRRIFGVENLRHTKQRGKNMTINCWGCEMIM